MNRRTLLSSCLIFSVLLVFPIFIKAHSQAEESKQISLPTVIQGDIPLYPPMARVAGIHGIVKIRVTTDGSKVATAEIISGPPMLSAEALTNLKSWKFKTHEPTTFETVFEYQRLEPSQCELDTGDVTLHLPLKVIVAAKGIQTCDPNEVIMSSAQNANLFSAPLQSTDIGAPTLPGKTTPTADGLTITASGRDIWDKSDQFHFAYQKQSGDFDVTVRVASLAPTHEYTRAGIMARASLAPNSRHVFFLVFPDNQPRHKNTSAFEFQFRTKTGGDSNAIYPPAHTKTPAYPVHFPNTWLRLQRTGNLFTASLSSDGKSWQTYTTHTLALPTEIYLGLAVTSETESASTTATFTNLEVPSK